jgi:hypothetical protein
MKTKFSHKINKLNNNANITISKFNNKRVIYFFNIINENNMEDVICKIGYTEDIQQRISDIESKYKVKLILIAIKKINYLRDEKHLHQVLRTFYPHLVVNKVNNIPTKEMYYFNDILLEEFEKYNETCDKKYEYKYLIKKEKTEQLKLKLKIEKEKTEQLKLKLKIEKEKTKQIKNNVDFEKEKTNFEKEKTKQSKNKKDIKLLKIYQTLLNNDNLSNKDKKNIMKEIKKISS